MESSLQTIKELRPIKDADKIEVAQVGNFQCVVEKDVHKVGDRVVHIQADAVLPADRAWAQESLKYAPKRVKIIRLRGVWSEGFVLPLGEAFAALESPSQTLGDVDPSDLDWDAGLGLTHYEAPIPQEPGAIATGLPYFVPETGADRWEIVLSEGENRVGVLTQKIDGLSATFVLDKETDSVRVFGRTLEYDPLSGSIYARVYRNMLPKLQALLDLTTCTLAIRGEIYGEGAQAHKYNTDKRNPLSFAMYSIYNVEGRHYLQFEDVCNISDDLGIPTVPIIDMNFMLNTITARQVAETCSGEGNVLWCGGQAIKILSLAYDGNK